MNENLKRSLEHADNVSKLYGLNVRGCSLDFIKRAVEDTYQGDTEDVDILHAWQECGQDILREDENSCTGHMSERDIAVLHAEANELIQALGLCDTVEEVEALLKKE